MNLFKKTDLHTFVLLLLQKNKNTIHKRNCEPIKYKYLPDKCGLKKILNVQLLAKVSRLSVDFIYFEG